MTKLTTILYKHTIDEKQLSQFPNGLNDCDVQEMLFNANILITQHQNKYTYWFIYFLFAQFFEIILRFFKISLLFIIPVFILTRTKTFF